LLTSRRIRNFKAVADQQDIRLSNLTVLAGANSSGKSSQIQSIFMLMQTMESDASNETLLLNGDKLSLGTANDIWHAGREDEELDIRNATEESQKPACAANDPRS
jgi:predicted ATPase